MLEGNQLVLKAWDGQPATEHITIGLGEGLCGAAAPTGEVVLVSDISKDQRYIACFPTIRSEIAVPIKSVGAVLEEIDVDGDHLNAFDSKDKAFLKEVAKLLSDRTMALKGEG